MPTPIPVTFLGTGGFHATAGYWNSFLIGGRILVETAPAVLRNLRVAGVKPNDIEVIFISHFHADHTFGWPFVMYSSLVRERRTADLWVVGPKGIQAFLENMMAAGKLDHVVENARKRFDGGYAIHYVEVDEGPQTAGSVSFRAVRVDHDPMLECFGYQIEVDGRTIGYSGDTTLCPGLRTIAGGVDTLIMECNSHHDENPVHLNFDDVRTIRQEFPDLPIVLTHHSDDVDSGGLPNVRVPADFETITI